MKATNSKTSWITNAVTVLVALIVVGGVLLSFAANFSESEAYDCTVTEKDPRIPTYGGTKITPRVYTSCGTYEIRDVFPFHYGAGDVYGALEVGETYDLTLRGWRVPILSMFPAVTEVK